MHPVHPPGYACGWRHGRSTQPVGSAVVSDELVESESV